MSIPITTWGNHTVEFPITVDWNLKQYQFNSPDKAVYNGLSSDMNNANYQILGDRLNQPAAIVQWRQDPNGRDLYRGTSVPVAYRFDGKGKAIVTSVVAFYYDTNDADGSVKIIPVRCSLTVEAPWDYPGIDSILFEDAVSRTTGIALSNPTGLVLPAPFPESNSNDDFNRRLQEMFSGDIDPKSSTL